MRHRNTGLTWTALTLINGWNAGSGDPPEWLIDQHGQVRLRGTITNSSPQATGHQFSTMPAGTRPSRARLFPGVATDLGVPAARIDVFGAGSLQIGAAYPGTKLLSLASMTWRVDT